MSAWIPATALAVGRELFGDASPVRPSAWRSGSGMSRPFASFSKVDAHSAWFLPRL